LRVFLFVSFAVLLSSCFDKGDCLFVNTNLVRVNLMDLDTPSRTHPIVLDTVFGPSPYFFAIDTTVTAFALVVDPARTESKFILLHKGIYDTLVLGYTNRTIVLSPDCGAALFQENLEVKYSTFDSVRIVTGQLLTSAKVNLEIRL
jgi:hypothetical protein